MTYSPDTHYSEHFSRQELDCHCGCTTPPAVAENLHQTAYLLEELRHFAGGYPITVDCGYRCPTHNATVGGVPDSQHILGKAADIRQPGIHSPAQLAIFAADVKAYRDGGIGTYHTEGFVHVDWRGNGPARWQEP